MTRNYTDGIGVGRLAERCWTESLSRPSSYPCFSVPSVGHLKVFPGEATYYARTIIRSSSGSTSRLPIRPPNIDRLTNTPK